MAANRITTRLILFLFILSFLSFASGQQIQEQVEVQLVQIDVVATDSKGNMITDLTADDFVLKENGKVQTITHFYNSANDEIRYPLTMSFLVDTSYSMQQNVAGMTRIDVAKNAAELVMENLKSTDQIELIEFNDKSTTLVPFTSDLSLLDRAFENMTFQKANTAMWDGIVYALNQIKEQSGRKILVIFSDGMDNASKSIEEDAEEAIRKADTTLIAFYSEFASVNFPQGSMMGTPSGPTNRMKILIGEDLLRQFTEISGGQFFSFRKEPELLKALDEFRALIHSQYTLAYKPTAPKKIDEFRKIKVECKRKGVKLRYRDGYYAN
jgi:Ca-activated chloride channel family protein